jgi:hypothetical protein
MTGSTAPPGGGREGTASPPANPFATDLQDDYAFVDEGDARDDAEVELAPLDAGGDGARAGGDAADGRRAGRHRRAALPFSGDDYATSHTRLPKRLYQYIFPPEAPRAVQLFRPENIAVPACYLLVGLLQGLSGPFTNVYPLDLNASEAQQVSCEKGGGRGTGAPMRETSGAVGVRGGRIPRHNAAASSRALIVSDRSSWPMVVPRKRGSSSPWQISAALFLAWRRGAQRRRQRRQPLLFADARGSAASKLLHFKTNPDAQDENRNSWHRGKVDRLKLTNQPTPLTSQRHTGRNNTRETYS